MDYDIIVKDEYISINPANPSLKKMFLRNIIQDFLQTPRKPTNTESNLPYHLTKTKLQANNSSLVTKSKDKVGWKELVKIFKDTMNDISNMTLSEINTLVRITQDTTVGGIGNTWKKVTHPIKDLTESNIINLLGRGEQTEEGEKWMNRNLSDAETKTYLDEVWEKIKTGNTRNFTFNDEKTKIDKLKELNVSRINSRMTYRADKKAKEEDEEKGHIATLPKDSKISMDYWKSGSPKDTLFTSIHGSTDKKVIGTVISTNKKVIMEFLDLKKVELDLDSNTGYPILIQTSEQITPNSKVSIADNLVTITEIEEVRDGNFIAWFNEQPYDSARWKAGSKTDDERRNIYRESDLQESTKEEIIKAAILMIMRPLLINMKTTYKYTIRINDHKADNAITVRTQAINDITTTEQSPRSKGDANDSQDYGQTVKHYKAKTILSVGATHEDALKAQMFLRKINYGYNTLNRAIEHLGE
jgi:hypothetical protein